MADSTEKLENERNPAVKRSADSTYDSGSDSTEVAEVKKKISFGLSKPGINLSLRETKMPTFKPLSSGLTMKLGIKTTKKQESTIAKPKLGKPASAFASDEDEDTEEMPPEAKMRMKNIGRETPTSSGPNSFGKSKMGFCDAKKMHERNMKDTNDDLTE